MQTELIEGLIVGVVFGFFLQRARVDRYDVQIGAMLLEDMTIFKFMLPAIFVGIVGIYGLNEFGLVEFHIKPTILSVNILGGLLFGIGWAIFGLCPGTAGGALGEGHWDTLFGIMGMFVGAALFAQFYPMINHALMHTGDYGQVTIPQIFGLSPWLVGGLFIGFSTLLLWFFEKRGL
jgi:uncharacterized membrane protein YedE/YeeE